MSSVWNKKRKQSTLESCLESFEENGQNNNEITEALIYYICKDSLPLSCVEKSGLQQFVRAVSPLYTLPSRQTVTRLIKSRYNTTKAVLMEVLDETNFLCLTSEILTFANSTSSFLVLTVHFVVTIEEKNLSTIQSINLCAQKLSQGYTAEYINEIWNDICTEFAIDKSKIVSITTNSDVNMVAAVQLFSVDEHRIPCITDCLNLIVDGVLEEVPTFSTLYDHIKSIVAFFEQSVDASDQLRMAQKDSGKKEGEVLTLTEAVSSRWISGLDMLERFVKLSELVATILATESQTNENTPDMVATSQLEVIRDLITLLGPFKQAAKEISAENNVTSSLVIPFFNFIRQITNKSTPSTTPGEAVKAAILKKVEEKLVFLEKNTFLSAATILDPRFKRLYFTSPLAVSDVISRLSNDICLEHRRRKQQSPNRRPAEASPESGSSFIWHHHEKLIKLNTNKAEIPSFGCVPDELKQYLDQPFAERKTDPIEFWVHWRHFTPVLSEIALKYLICQASSASSERLASAVNLAVPDNRSRKTGEHMKERVLLMSIPDDYWLE